MGKLNALGLKRLVRPGRYGDGDGLWLQVRDAERRSWLFRYTRQGRAREMGLGGAESVSLAEARAAAAEARRVLREGGDPIERRREAEAQQRQAAAAHTFRSVTDLYIAAHEAGWRNAKHRWQWRATLEAHAFPVFGDEPVTAVNTAMVMRALEPIWRQMPETASRLRGRIEAVIDYAKAHGWREGENPARWRGHLTNLLPAPRKIARVEHHAALPWVGVSAFMARLRTEAGIAARALEFTILTAARTGETVGARWSELDLQARIWTVPGERMKAGREHRVPLTEAVLATLAQLAPLRPDGGDGFVFPGNRKGRGLSNMAMLMLLRRMQRPDLTVHGFRSTFRDWVSETTGHPREVAEAALAHVVGNQVEAAYRRGDLFEKRRRLMEDWAAFCARPAPAASAALPRST